MAKQIIEKLLDDIDGGPADENVTFALDGRAYEIDLSDANAKELRDVLAKFIERGRPAPKVHHAVLSRSRPFGSSGAGRAAVDREQNQAIRDWAKRNGYDISDRGRIPQDVVDAFHAKRPNPHPSRIPARPSQEVAEAPAAPEAQEPAPAPAKAVRAAKAAKAAAAEKAAPQAVFQSGGKKDEVAASK